MAARSEGRRGFRWARSADETLLELRLSELGLRIESTWVMECVEALHAALERRGLRFRPHVWFSNEWFTPKGVPGIAVPFYLGHPRLMRLERRQMLECEGGSRADCTRYLRHECGHALQNAFGLSRRRRWRELFGSSTEPYPRHYRADPGSRDHVQHLRLYYAQSHPDEDFAETFAVWMQPRATWRRRYAGWPASEKLEYVDAIMGELAGQRPRLASRRVVDPIQRDRTTLASHYARKRRHYLKDTPRVHDRELRRLFSDEPRHRGRERASAFLRRHRADLRALVARRTGESTFTLDHVLDEMILRCRELRLAAVGGETRLRRHFAELLTDKTIHYLSHRRSWIPL